MKVLWLAVGLCIALSGCAAGILPPGRFEARSGASLGAVEGGAELGTSYGYAAGVHAASAVDKELPVDLGVGYVQEHTSRKEHTTDSVHRGIYLEGSGVIHRNKGQTLWAGLRGEVLWAPGESDPTRFYGSARLSWEVTAPVNGSFGESNACGFAAGSSFGMFGFGAFVEGGYQVDTTGTGGYVALAGVTVRTPLLAVVAMDVCGN